MQIALSMSNKISTCFFPLMFWKVVIYISSENNSMNSRENLQGAKQRLSLHVHPNFPVEILVEIHT